MENSSRTDMTSITVTFPLTILKSELCTKMESTEYISLTRRKGNDIPTATRRRCSPSSISLYFPRRASRTKQVATQATTNMMMPTFVSTCGCVSASRDELVVWPIIVKTSAARVRRPSPRKMSCVSGRFVFRWIESLLFKEPR